VKKRFFLTLIIFFLNIPLLFSTDRWSGVSFEFLIRKFQPAFIEAQFESLSGENIEEYEPNLYETIYSPQFRLFVSSNVANPFDIVLAFKPMKLEGSENFLPYTVRVFQEGGTLPWVTLDVDTVSGKSLGPLKENTVDGSLKEFIYLFALEFNSAIVENLQAGNYKGEIKVVINEGT